MRAGKCPLPQRNRRANSLVECDPHLGFMQKLNAGLGTFFAGQVLSFINFDRLNHTSEQAYTLAFVQGPVTTLLMVVPILIFSTYSLSERKHREILNKLN